MVGAPKFSEKLLWCACFSFYIPVKFEILSLNVTELTRGDFFFFDKITLIFDTIISDIFD